MPHYRALALGCFEENNELKNQHLAEWMLRKKWMNNEHVLTKTFLHVILAAKWLVRHSSMSPKQQRRPLPSLLSDSSSMGGDKDQF